MVNLFGDAEFWVLIAFIVFIVLIGRKAKSAMNDVLEKRSNDIREKISNTENTLLEAQKLLKNSQDILRDHKKSSEKLIKEQEEIALKNSEIYLENIDQEVERKKSSAAKEIEFIHSNAASQIQEKISKLVISSIEDLLSNEFKTSKNSNLANDFIDQIPSALSYFKK